MTFGEILANLRMNRGLSQKEVAKAVGMSLSAYQRYEYHQREPAYKYLIALADFFEVSLDYLVGRSDNP